MSRGWFSQNRSKIFYIPNVLVIMAWNIKIHLKGSHCSYTLILRVFLKSFLAWAHHYCGSKTVIGDWLERRHMITGKECFGDHLCLITKEPTRECPCVPDRGHNAPNTVQTLMSLHFRWIVTGTPGSSASSTRDSIGLLQTKSRQM